MSTPNGLVYALQRLHSGENRMHAELLRVSAEHRDEHEIHHVARDLAAWSAEHVRALAQDAGRHGISLDDEADEPSGTASRLRAAVSTVTGRRPAPELRVLEDLRELYLQASDNSLAWEMLAQYAQARRVHDLLATAERCHPQNLRQMRWANGMIKTLTPQLLTSV